MNPADINYGTDAWGGLRTVDPTANYMQGAAQGAYGSSVAPGAINAAVPGMGSGFGFNMDTGKLVLGGLGTIANIWNAFQAQKLAKEQFKFQKDITETNLANQIKSYNTTLADRGRSRAFTEGQSAETAAAYVRDNSLTRRPQ